MSNKTYTVNDIVKAIGKHYSFLAGMTHGGEEASGVEAQLVLAVLAWLDEDAHSKWTPEYMTQILVDGNVMGRESAVRFVDGCINEYGDVVLY